MNKQTLHIAAGAACSTDSAKPVSVSRMPWDTPAVINKKLTGKVSHTVVDLGCGFDLALHVPRW